MRALLIDTNAYSAFMRGDAPIVEAIAHTEVLHLNAVVLGELLGGFAAGSREPANRALLARFMASPRVSVLPLTATTADSYALVDSGLRRRGQPIPSNDLWIAASALEHGCALLTLDAHFRQVEGLRCGAQLDDFLPWEADQAARYSAAVEVDLTAAALAGAGGSSDGKNPAIVRPAIDAVTNDIVAPLRERLTRCIDKADGNNSDLAAEVRALYREWKTHRIDEHVEDIVRLAYDRGALTLAPR